MTESTTKRGLALMRTTARVSMLVASLVSWTISCAHAHETGGRTVLKVNYMPFFVETLTPVTEGNISKRTKACDITTGDEVSAIMTILESASPSNVAFADDFVRLRVARPEANGRETVVAVVDKVGAVRGRSSEVRRLTRERLAELNRFLSKRCEW